MRGWNRQSTSLKAMVNLLQAADLPPQIQQCDPESNAGRLFYVSTWVAAPPSAATSLSPVPEASLIFFVKKACLPNPSCRLLTAISTQTKEHYLLRQTAEIESSGQP